LLLPSYMCLMSSSVTLSRCKFREERAELLHRACENFLYSFKAARKGRSRRRLGGRSRTPADAHARLAQAHPSAGTKASSSGPLTDRQLNWGRDGFDKGTLAAAHIGLMRAGQKPAQVLG